MRLFPLFMILAFHIPSAFASCVAIVAHGEDLAPEQMVTDGYKPLANFKYISPDDLGFTPLVSDTVFGGPDSPTRQISVVTKLQDPNTKENIAILSYTIDYDRPERLQTSDLNIQRKDLGLTRELFSRVLRLNPQLREVREWLTGRQNQQAAANLATMECADAIINTDVVQMIYKLGFTKVIDKKCKKVLPQGRNYQTSRQAARVAYEFKIILGLP